MTHDELVAQVKSANELVNTWPAWKRNVLENSGKSTVSVPRTPIGVEDMNQLRPESWPFVASRCCGGGYLSMGIGLSCSIPLTDVEKSIAFNVLHKLWDDIETERVKNDPTLKQGADEMVNALTKCFVDAGQSPVFVERIKNEYSNGSWCIHRPWLIVTTSKGRVKIGWRKRVIEIDWSDSLIDIDGDHIFVHEKVTTGPHMVHAWGYKNATEYLRVIFSN